MPYFVAPGGAFKRVIASYVAPSGTWKRVVSRWVGVDGVWKLKFSSGAVQLEPALIRGFAYDPDSALARIDFNPDGTVIATFTDQTVLGTENLGNWFEPPIAGVGAGFEIKAQRVAGSAVPSGDDTSTWLPLSEQREWEVGDGVRLNTSNAATLEIAIRPVGGTDPVAVAPITLNATRYGSNNPNSAYGRGGGIDQIHAPYRFFQEDR